MPPMYINIGAYVDEETMIDSHALVGSCAQIGKRVHLSAGAQIGGVLEPVGSHRVIVEDDVLIGGIVGLRGSNREAKLGRPLESFSPWNSVYDVEERIYRKTENQPLTIPEGCGWCRIRPLEKPGQRDSAFWQLGVIKYRDEGRIGRRSRRCCVRTKEVMVLGATDSWDRKSPGLSRDFKLILCSRSEKPLAQSRTFPMFAWISRKSGRFGMPWRNGNLTQLSMPQR